MKTSIILSIGLLVICLSASAQSVVIRVISNDGSTQATNTTVVAPIHIQGLLSRWADDSRSKTNTQVAALTFGEFVTQELTDKSAEWRDRGGIEAIKTFMAAQGASQLTNSIPPRLAIVWSTLTQVQRTNAVNYLLQTQ